MPPTIEKVVYGLLKNLPESEQREESSNVEVNNNKLFSEATEVFQYYGWKIENEWDYYIKNTLITEVLPTLEKVEQVMVRLKNKLLRETEINSAKILKELIESLEYYKNCITDALEFEKIATEVIELRLNPSTGSRLKKAKDILFSL